MAFRLVVVVCANRVVVVVVVVAALRAVVAFAVVWTFAGSIAMPAAGVGCWHRAAKACSRLEEQNDRERKINERTKRNKEALARSSTVPLTW